MDRLRSLPSTLSAHLPSFTSSTPGKKLTKAFRFGADSSILEKVRPVSGGGGGMPGTYGAGRSGDVFRDGPIVEEPSLGRVHKVLHCADAFFTFLALCLMAAVAAFQAKWFGVSGGTGFVLFLLLAAFFTGAGLLIIPIVYDRWDKLKRPAQFLAQSRSTLILHAFGCFLMLLAAFIVTVSAWTEKGCKDAANDPHESLGDSYTAGLGTWCNTKKASAIFDWFAFAGWAALTTLSVLSFRQTRRREPTFAPPSPTYPIGGGQGYTTISGGDRHDEPEAEDAVYSNGGRGHARPEMGYAYARPVSAGGTGTVGSFVAQGMESQQALARPSVDAYGAFESDMPGQSRTMQLAYTDPYAQIRASLLTDNAAYGQAPATYGHEETNSFGYANGAIPHPPSFR
ncbi:hypothetical protein Q5752_004104 [Cryptotrichosporon argae]